MLTRLSQQTVRLLDRFSVFLLYMGMVCVGFMMAIGVADVLGTALVNQPIPGTFELTEVAMVIVIYGSLAYVQGRRRHITMTLVVSRMPERVRNLLEIVAHFAGLFLAVLIVWAGCVFTWHSWQAREYYQGMLPLPMYPWKFALVLGTSIMAIKLITDIISSFTILSRGLIGYAIRGLRYQHE